MPPEGEATEGAAGQEPTQPEPEAKEGQEPQADKAETFPREYVEQLRSEAAGRRDRVKELEAKVQEFEDANASAVEKAENKASRAEKRASEAEAKLLRYEVASEKEVPTKLVPLLSATTREELEAQADLIVENAKASAPAPDFDGGARETAPEPKTPEQAHNELFLRELGIAPQT